MRLSAFNRTALYSAVAAVLIPATSSIATAQQSLVIEEIVVTARKRDESITDVPLSIQAMSQDDLQSRGLTELESLAGFTPNLDFQNVGNSQGGRWNSAIRFRGMDARITTPTSQSGGFFVDGAALLGGAGSVSFSDVASVEVIRGPQPVYFGRGTFGGAINYTTVTPGQEFAGELSASFSPRFGSSDFNAWVEGGLTDNLSARLTVFNRTVGSAFTGSDGVDLGEENTRGISAIFAFDANDSISMKARIAYSEDDDGSPSASFLRFAEMGNISSGTPVTVNTASGVETTAYARSFFSGALPYSKSFVSHNSSSEQIEPIFFGTNLLDGSRPSSGATIDLLEWLSGLESSDAPKMDKFGLKAELLTASYSIDWDLNDALTLSGVFSYGERNVGNLRDADQTDYQKWATHSFLEMDSKSAEVRLSYDEGSALRVMVGANLTEIDQYGDVDGGFNFFEPFGGLSGWSISSLDIVEVETMGVFASVEYDITDQITATVEARYQDEEITRQGGTPGRLTTPSTLDSQSVLPRFSISYAPFEDASLYFSYAEGEQPALEDTSISRLSAAEQARFKTENPGFQEVTDEETLEAYELGWKQTALDGALWFSAVYFTQEWKEMKAVGLVNFTLDNGSTRPYFPFNSGSSTQEGVELEARWMATENLTVNASAGYTKAEYDDYLINKAWTPASDLLQLGGLTLPRSPEKSAALGFDWADSLNNDWDYNLRADIVYRDKTYADQLNLVEVKGYTLVNLRAGVENADFSIELFCNNCTDRAGWATAKVATDFVDFFNVGAVVDPIMPREVGVSASYKF